MKRRVEPQLFGEDRQFLFDEIEAVERTLDCPFTDNARHELAIYLQVMTLRIRKGKSVPARATAIPPAFAAMLGRIEKHYGITLGSGEKAVVIELFSVAARRWTPDFQDTYTPDRESAHLADDLFRALADRYGARPASHLRKPLAMLFEAGITLGKLDRAIALPPEISWTVRFENMTLFMRLAQLMRDTPSLSSVDLYETDLTRIAMLLLDFMDGIAVSDTWRAGLVVNCGVEQVLFARDRIERFLPFIRIARVIPESEEAGGSTALDGLDFLISFDPIETALPVAVISSAITELDRRHINDTILTIAQHRAQGDRPVDDDLPARELPQMEGESAPRCPASRTHQGESVGGHRRGVPQDLRDVLIHLRQHAYPHIFLARGGANGKCALLHRCADSLPPDAAHPCRRARRINLRRARAGCALPDLPPQAGDGRTRPRGAVTPHRETKRRLARNMPSVFPCELTNSKARACGRH